MLAFGSPLGLENSASLGVVSAVARQLKPDDPMIYVQTDASINPGNSGGPLVDAAGRMVGLNTMILSQSGGNEGIGLAAPSNIVRSVYEQLRRSGRVRRGVDRRARPDDHPAARRRPRPASSTAASCSPTSRPSGPAAAAGLRPGDVVIALDGKPMENARQLDVNLYRRAPGETVTLSVRRGAESLDVPVAVVERPEDPDRFAVPRHPGEEPRSRGSGVLALELDDDLRRSLGPLRGTRGRAGGRALGQRRRRRGRPAARRRRLRGQRRVGAGPRRAALGGGVARPRASRSSSTSSAPAGWSTSWWRRSSSTIARLRAMRLSSWIWPAW